MKIKEYWLNELAESKKLPLNLILEKQDFPSKLANVYQISFDSLYGERIFGWFLEPKNAENYPLVVDYIGYMNHLESPLQFTHWLSIGCGVLVTDSRGQGGKTLDQASYKTFAEERLMAKGFLDKNDFYLKRVYWDALRLLDVSQALKKVDKNNLFIHGTSQGGGVGLFANSLTPYKIKYGFYDVPSHANLTHRVETGAGSYEGIHDYVAKHPESKNKIEENLEFFDIKNVVENIMNPVLISVGNEDPVCPKEDFYVAFKKINASKEIDVYEAPGHGGGGNRHTEKILNYILKEIDGE